MWNSKHSLAFFLIHIAWMYSFAMAADFTEDLPDAVQPDVTRSNRFHDKPVLDWVQIKDKWVPIQDGSDVSGVSMARRFFIDNDEEITYTDVNFSGCNLEGTYWQGFIYLRHCNFSKANLKYSREISDPKGDFTDAEIEGAEIYLSEKQLVSTASYQRKNLAWTSLHQPVHQVSFAGFLLRNTLLTVDEVCDLTDADIRGSADRRLQTGWGSYGDTWEVPCVIPVTTRIRFYLSSQRMNQGEQKLKATEFPWRMIQSTKSYQEGTLEGFTFDENVDWSTIDVSGLNLTNAVLGGNWENAQFEDAVITGADCRGLTLEQIKQTWNYKYGHMEGVTVSEEVQAALEAEKAAQEETSTTESATTSADTTETSNAAETDTAETSPESSKMLPETNETSELGSDTSAVPQPES